MTIKFIEKTDDYSKYLHAENFSFIYHLDSDEYEFHSIDDRGFPVKYTFILSELFHKQSLFGSPYPHVVCSSQFACPIFSDEMFQQFISFTGIDEADFLTSDYDFGGSI